MPPPAGKAAGVGQRPTARGRGRGAPVPTRAAPTRPTSGQGPGSWPPGPTGWPPGPTGGPGQPGGAPSLMGTPLPGRRARPTVGAGRRQVAGTASYRRGAAPGCHHDSGSHHNESQGERAPPMFPESGQTVAAFTSGPEDAQQHEDRADHFSKAPHRSRIPWPFRPAPIEFLREAAPTDGAAPLTHGDRCQRHRRDDGVTTFVRISPAPRSPVRRPLRRCLPAPSVAGLGGGERCARPTPDGSGPLRLGRRRGPGRRPSSAPR